MSEAVGLLILVAILFLYDKIKEVLAWVLAFLAAFPFLILTISLAFIEDRRERKEIVKRHENK